MIATIIIAVLVLGVAGFVAYRIKRKKDKEENKKKEEDKETGELCKPPTR